jgi:transcriptional regulator with XRE-family HTH domain
MNKPLKTFAELANQARQNIKYHVQGAILEFTEDIVGRMGSRGVNKAQLAQKLGTSPAYVTKMLGGNTNFTLETMVKVANALGTKLRVHLQPDGSVTQWVDVLETVGVAEQQPCEFLDWAELGLNFSASQTSSRKSAPNEEFAAAA